MSLIGQKIMNYRIDSKIGEGGMGSVYLATHEFLHTRAAIKVLHPSLGANSNLRGKILNRSFYFIRFESSEYCTRFGFS